MVHFKIMNILLQGEKVHISQRCHTLQRVLLYFARTLPQFRYSGAELTSLRHAVSCMVFDIVVNQIHAVKWTVNGY